MSRGAGTAVSDAGAGSTLRTVPRMVSIAAALGYLAVVMAIAGHQPPSGATPVDAGHLTIGQPPSIERPGDAISLPSDWRDDCPDCSEAWYDFRIALNPTGDAPVLYLPRLRGTLDVYLNGELLATGLRSADPVAAGAPRLLLLPAPLLDAALDRLVLRLTGDRPGDAVLSRAYFGEHGDLLWSYRMRDLVAGGMPRFATALCAIVAVLLAALWAQRREVGRYAWLAVVAILFAAVCARGWLLGGAGVAGHWLHACAVVALAACAARFALATCEPVPALARWLMPAAGASVALLTGSALPGGALFATLHLLLPAAWLVVLVLAHWPLMVARPQAPATAAWSSAAAIVISGLALHDAARVFDPATSSLIAFGAPVYVVVFTWGLLTRFFDGVRRTEALNAELDGLVRAKTRKIEEQYQAMARMEEERILAGERERILQDMHDGLGGQLVSALAMIDCGHASDDALREALVEALTDMRLMIDSLDAVDDDLNAVLAMFRDRMNPRLSAAGIDLRWQVEDLEAVAGLGPSRVLGILRIMQESVTNSLKHAEATRITVRARNTPDGVELTLADDGRGFDADAVETPGHGLKSLQRRAAEHGIRLAVHSAPGDGTRVVLRFGPSRSSA